MRLTRTPAFAAFVGLFLISAPDRPFSQAVGPQENERAPESKGDQAGERHQQGGTLQQAPPVVLPRPDPAGSRPQRAETRDGDQEATPEQPTDEPPDVLQTVFTGILIMVGIGQAAAAFLQWGVYSRQERIMGEQRAIMAKQSDLTISIQRAFIHIRQTNGGLTIDTINNRVGAVFQTEMINSGPTPAKNLSVWTNSGKFAGGMPDDFGFPRPPRGEAQGSMGQVGPSGEFLTGMTFLSYEDIMDIWNGSHRVHVWGRCEYNDAFQNTPRHFLTFCYEVAINNSRVFTLTQEELISAVEAGLHNEAPPFNTPVHGRGNETD
jgi:hypothetical protein